MNQYDIIIIGAGAAGLTAGIYAARAKKSVLVLEKTAAGGQILNTTKVENYPGIDSISGQEFGEKLKSQVKKFGGEILTAEVLKVTKSDTFFKVETDADDFSARSIILANGSRERRLGLENETDFIGKGVSYCATCDGALFKDKTVAVYGGGNTAAYSVLYLANICKKVYWLFRKPEPRAEKHLVEKIKALGNVEIRAKTLVRTLTAGEDGNLSSLGLETTETPGASVSTGLQALPVRGLFILIGREPDNARFKDLLDLDAEGYIKSDETCQTSCEGVFCAGDTRKKPLNQLVTATADGAVAASAAVNFLG